MASVLMTMPLAGAAIKARVQPPTCYAFFKPLRMKESKRVVSSSNAKLRVHASSKEKTVAGVTAAAAAASIVVPEVAQAATDVLIPSLENFLLSIASGGVLLVGAFIAVANFDPVKRN